jgi:subfamily B ATP-binding cassette protein MsbA
MASAFKEILGDLKDDPADQAKRIEHHRAPDGAPGPPGPARGPRAFPARGPLEKPKNFRYKDLRLLVPFLSPHWPVGLFAALTGLLGTVGTILIPLSFKVLADDAVLAGNHSVLTAVILVVIGALSFVALTEFLKQVCFYRFQQEVVYDLQRSLFNRLLRLPKAFFDSSSTGYLMSRAAGDVFQLQAFFSVNLVDVFARSLQLVCAVGILLYLSWKLTLVSLVVLPLFVVISRMFTDKTRRASRWALEKNAIASRDLEERLSGASLIKAFAAEDREAQAIMASVRDAFDSNRKRVTITAFFALLSQLINAVGMGCVLWYGASLVINRQLTVGELLAFSVYLGFLIEPAKFFANLNNSLQHSFAALERVFELMSLVPEDQSDETRTRVDKLGGRVEVENVSFSYDGRERVLDGISFQAEAGQLISIVGPSGAGKSTLVNLIMCLYQPASGTIRFDSVPTSQLNLQSLRERIGIVSQEILLFNDSIRNNIRYGRIGASDEEVANASRIAGAHEFISEMAEGYDTRVGEKGVKLSVGQKQRLSIARAILKDPDILIFDEATSALDPLTEQSVQTLMREFSRGKTVFAIAHRFSTVAASDVVIVMDKGQIVQCGTHEELWSRDGLYQQLCETQLARGAMFSHAH